MTPPRCPICGADKHETHLPELHTKRTVHIPNAWCDGGPTCPGARNNPDVEAGFVTRGFNTRSVARCRCGCPRTAHHYLNPNHEGAGALLDLMPCTYCQCGNYISTHPIDVPDPQGRFT